MLGLVKHFRASDFPFKTTDNTVLQGLNHPCSGMFIGYGIRRFEPQHPGRHKSTTRIIVRMPKNKDEIDPGVPQLVKPFFDQFPANALRLGFGRTAKGASS